MDLTAFLPQVEAYLPHAALTELPGYRPGRPCALSPLAQGEYNMNYLLRQDEARWVLRVNVGTQIARDDQIDYEFRALRLLADSGATPRPYFVDDTRAQLALGVLAMEYLPGEPLDYRRDLAAAGRLFARVHQQPVAAADNHLILEERPLSLTCEECARLLTTYLESPLADTAVRDYLRDVLAWAQQARARERFFVEDPCRCVINTEVNSGNFIADRTRGTLHLVDWEKPLWGDPSQDLSHFAVPTTTLWKSEHLLNRDARRTLLDAYRGALRDRHLADTIEERVRLRDPFNCLRGVSWSAMAWVSYQDGAHALRNPDTFRKMTSYLRLGFLRRLFDPHLARATAS